MEFPPLAKVGEQIQNLKERADQFEERIYQKTGGNRLLAYLALSLSSVTLLSVGVAVGEGMDTDERPAITHIACGEDCTQVLDAAVLEARPQTTTPTTEAPPPAYVRPKVEGINPVVEANMNAMKLTPEGYKDFFNKIDRSYMPYALTKGVFNNDLIGRIAQTLTQKKKKSLIISDDFLLHNFGYNPSTLPDGHVDIKALIDFEASRGPVCCGMNWVVDTDKVFQLAPANAKLWSNPPYLMRAVEVRAYLEEDIKTPQYELLAYLTIADLINQKLLDPNDPIIKAQGHDEMRESWNATHPHEQYDDKKDFTTLSSQYFRIILAEFVRDNPEVFELTQPL